MGKSNVICIACRVSSWNCLPNDDDIGGDNEMLILMMTSFQQYHILFPNRIYLRRKKYDN